MTSPPSPESGSRPAEVRVSAPACVRCGKPVEARFRPFCSQRCADIDLGAWVSGAYRVATDERPAEADAADAAGDPTPVTRG